MLNYILLVISVFVAVCSVTNGDNKLGDFCTLASGIRGKCRLLSECQTARDNLKNNIIPEVCGFKKTKLIVCCPREVGDISKEKCAEYSAYAYDPSKNSTKICDLYFLPLILGGEEVTETEFPHMVAVGFDHPSKGMQWVCGGSLISSQYVLTAAHCLSHQDGDMTHVRLGVTNLNKTDYRQIIGISALLAHPDYHYPQVYHDIGLIKLEKPAVLNRHVRPACLTKTRFTGPKAVATGWGLTESNEPSNTLLKVTLKVVDLQTCNKTYKSHISRKIKNGISLTNLCAMSDKKNQTKDTCMGDSGGPLQVYHDKVKCMYDVVAITSFGLPCGSKTAGVYERVSDHLEWIEEIVWPKT